MEAAQVTVVDQKGRLLNSKNSNSELSLTTKQFNYKNEIEEHLMARVENILMPIVGQGSMRVQVSADVDFTVTEKTQEMFNPDLPALRSEQTTEDQSSLSALQGCTRCFI
jgi:flagellar M-ring protein FliF